MATWADIQRGIFAGESGGDYGALFNYQNRPDGRFSNVDLTQMTVDQALQFSDPSGPYAQYVKGQVGRVATPMGAYQVVGSTLRSAKEGLGLTGNERMTPELQDRIGQWVYQTQGTGAWEGYKGPRVSTKGVSAMDGNNMNDQAMGAFNAMQEQNSSDKYKDIAGNLAVAFNSMRLNPDPNIASTIKDIRDARSEKQAKSKTLAYLEKIGRGDLVSAIGAGLSPREAISQMFSEAAETRAFERQKELATFEAGLTKPNPLTELAKIEADYKAGRLSPEQYQTAVEVYANKNKMGVRVGADGSIELVQGGGLSKLTEAQSKDINWAARMTGALEAFEPVADVLTSPTDKLFGLDPTGLARHAQSGDYQKAEVAGLEFLAPLLRKDTGAAVTPKEWDFYSKIYIPTIGDQPEALAAKKAARSRALEALKLGIPPEYVTRVQTVGGDPIAEAVSEGIIEKDKVSQSQQQPPQENYTWQNVPVGGVVVDTDGKKYKFTGGDRNQPKSWQEVN